MAPSNGSKAASMLGKMHLNAASSAAFWDASHHIVAPPLTTTYGNFTTVNSVTRFAFTTAPNVYTQFLVGFTPSAIRVFQWAAVSLAGPGSPPLNVWQQQQLDPSNTVPLDIRPLRLSTRIRNTTQNLNIAGSIKTALVPQSLAMSFTSFAALTPTAAASLWNLVEANPHAHVRTGVELTRGQTIVSPPSSYIAYNSYSDWVPVSALSVNGAGLTSADFALLNATTPAAISYPYIPTKAWPFSEIPTNHFMLLNVQPNPLAQTYDFEIYSQDAVRYPANTLAASVASRPATRTLPETVIQQASVSAAAQPVQGTGAMNAVGNSIRSALEQYATPDNAGNLMMAAAPFFGPAAPEVFATGGLLKGENYLNNMFRAKSGFGGA